LLEPTHLALYLYPPSEFWGWFPKVTGSLLSRDHGGCVRWGLPSPTGETGGLVRVLASGLSFIEARCFQLSLTPLLLHPGSTCSLASGPLLLLYLLHKLSIVHLVLLVEPYQLSVLCSPTVAATRQPRYLPS
jgi:hypothetical protein